MPRKKGQTVTPKTDAEKKAAAEAATKERRERFLGNRGSGRGAAAIKAILLWGEVANLKSYTFTETEVNEVNAAIDAAVTNVKAKFAAALKAPVVADADIPAFSFLAKPAPVTPATGGQKQKAA